MKSAIIASALLLGAALPVRAERCESLVIATYQGITRPLGDIYHERAGIKFWSPNWSPVSIIVHGELGMQLPLDQLVLAVNPCDRSVWLYPQREKSRDTWVKIGKLAKAVKPKIPKPPAEHDSKKLTSELILHALIDIGLHLLLK